MDNPATVLWIRLGLIAVLALSAVVLVAAAIQAN
jgi:hypothetical protein